MPTQRSSQLDNRAVIGLRDGAMALSAAHDAHNIVVVGSTDEDMAVAVREIERLQGGLVISRNGGVVPRLKITDLGVLDVDAWEIVPIQ